MPKICFRVISSDYLERLLLKIQLKLTFRKIFAQNLFLRRFNGFRETFFVQNQFPRHFKWLLGESLLRIHSKVKFNEFWENFLFKVDSHVIFDDFRRNFLLKILLYVVLIDFLENFSFKIHSHVIFKNFQGNLNSNFLSHSSQSDFLLTQLSSKPQSLSLPHKHTHLLMPISGRGKNTTQKRHEIQENLVKSNSNV